MAGCSGVRRISEKADECGGGGGGWGAPTLFSDLKIFGSIFQKNKVGVSAGQYFNNIEIMRYIWKKILNTR